MKVEIIKHERIEEGGAVTNRLDVVLSVDGELVQYSTDWHGTGIREAANALRLLSNHLRLLDGK